MHIPSHIPRFALPRPGEAASQPTDTHANYFYAWILYAMPGGLHCRLDTTTITAGTLAIGQWQHVAATYNGSIIRLYINGQQVGTAAKTGNLNATTRNVRIGMSGSPTGPSISISAASAWCSLPSGCRV